MKAELVVLAMAAAVVAVGVQRDTKVQATAERRYEAPEGGAVEGVGVCAITPDAVACWNMDGEPDPSLARRVQAAIALYGGQVPFQYGVRNRWLVLRQSMKTGVAYQSLDGGFSPTIPMQNRPGEPLETLVRSVTDPSDRTASVVAAVYGGSLGSVPTVPFRRGAVAKIGGSVIEIGKWREIERANPGNPQMTPGFLSWLFPPNDSTARRWWVVIGVRNTENSPEGYIGNFVPVDAQRRPIQVVDPNGQPVAGVKALESLSGRTIRQGKPDELKYSSVTFEREGYGLQDASIYLTNVDPRQIAALQVVVQSKPTRVLLTGFPLEPKR